LIQNCTSKAVNRTIASDHWPLFANYYYFNFRHHNSKQTKQFVLCSHASNQQTLKRH